MVPSTLVVEDEHGARVRPTAGSILFWLGGRGGERVEVAVRDGSFDLPRSLNGSWLDVGPIDADGVAC